MSPAKTPNAKTMAKLRAELEADRRAVEAQIARLDQEFAEESSTRPTSDDEVDTGSATSDRERTMSLARHARAQLVQVEAALQRMDDGTYGRCTDCGQPIPAARLEARPQSSTCMACQRAAEGGRR
jgi:RNA polymerase-binding protein DksA